MAGEWWEEPGSRPALTDAAVTAFVEAEFPQMMARGGVASLAALDGERDLNYLAKTRDGGQFVVKVANAQESEDRLQMENAALLHVASSFPGHLRSPHPLPTRLSSTTTVAPITSDVSSKTHLIRVLTFVSGQLWSALSLDDRTSPAFLASLGSAAAHLDMALSSFSFPGFEDAPPHVWDLHVCAKTVHGFVSHVPDQADRELIHRFLSLHKATALPLLEAGALPRQPSHSDINDNNAVASLSGSDNEWVVDGVFDFGDMVFTERVNNLAIACAYALFHSPPRPAESSPSPPSPPVDVICHAVAGYQTTASSHPTVAPSKTPPQLTKPELEALWSLVCMRLCTTCVMAARSVTLDPDNAAYLTVSQAPAWEALRRAAAVDPAAATGKILETAQSFAQNP